MTTTTAGYNNNNNDDDSKLQQQQQRRRQQVTTTTMTTTTAKRRAGNTCSNPENLNKKQLFVDLEVDKKEVMGINHEIYTEVLFYKKGMVGWPYVLGWKIKGKSGPEEGKFTKRRGVITEYKMQYVNLTGRFNWLTNPKTGTHNTATLSSPEQVTEVKLKEPLQTLVMKLYPQQWEGVPFFEIDAQYCPWVPPTMPTLPPATRAPTTPAPTPAPTAAPAPKKKPAKSSKTKPKEDFVFDEFDML
ncbi:hypothetical protein FSP39_004410 [Pinctada imbricata]|uniref:Uncharacterized protein n=1 Tax=Pinctada imbricata TaxID=66713 RepID=A0AA89C2I1_PINIB|nr:hypothetical protein FSP39_004410 [Pinctada imbricata]